MIRAFRADDADHLPGIFREAVSRLGPVAYSREQVAAWLTRLPEASQFRGHARDGSDIFIATDEADLPVGYVLCHPDGHLDQLYCHPDHGRHGLGRQLVEAVETAALQRRLPAITTHASEIARPLFEQSGYDILRRRDFQLGGVPIHNYAMMKRLR